MVRGYGQDASINLMHRFRMICRWFTGERNKLFRVNVIPNFDGIAVRSKKDTAKKVAKNS